MQKPFWTAFTSILMALPVSAASVDGIAIHSATAGSGKDVIFVHGWTCDSSSWAAQVPFFSKKYRVITLDLPGHGRSAAPKDGKFSIDLFARALEAVRQEAGADNVVLIGHSMGAMVIRQYTQLYPQHLAAIVGVDGLLDVRGMPKQHITEELPPLTGVEGMKTREKMIRDMFTPQTTAAVQRHVLDMMLAAPAATATGAASASYAWLRTKTDMTKVPAFAVYASTRSLPDAEEMKKGVPNYDAVQMPGTGHFLMMEQPEQFNTTVMTFLDRIRF